MIRVTSFVGEVLTCAACALASVLAVVSTPLSWVLPRLAWRKVAGRFKSLFVPGAIGLSTATLASLTILSGAVTLVLWAVSMWGGAR